MGVHAGPAKSRQSRPKPHPYVKLIACVPKQRLGLISTIESLGQYPEQWRTTNAVRQPPVSSQCFSVGSFSSGLPSYRSSHSSSFSQAPLRDSMSSSVSGYSHISDSSRNQHLLLADHLGHGPAEPTPHIASPVREPRSRSPNGKSNKKPAAQEKDYFKTCVSASKQSRLCSKQYKYFCTSCERPFVEKADWKRHEETYQERPEMFTCDLCPAIYFLEKDFTKHHAQSHRCNSCADTTQRSKRTHALSAKRIRMKRTGWGCGFCCHFSTDWTERCDHVARHMEKEGLTKSNWYHSKVLCSLLQRPAIYYEWMQLFRMRPGLTTCAWNQHSTGRVEGYPESDPTPQLQDYLEYFTADQDAATLAQLAYSKMVKHHAPSQTTVPPPVPPKDYLDTSLQEWTSEMNLWAQLTDSVVEDNILPTGVSRLEGWYPCR
jgi:hypothetical protein